MNNANLGNFLSHRKKLFNGVLMNVETVSEFLESFSVKELVSFGIFIIGGKRLTEEDDALFMNFITAIDILYHMEGHPEPMTDSYYSKVMKALYTHICAEANIKLGNDVRNVARYTLDDIVDKAHSTIAYYPVSSVEGKKIIAEQHRTQKTAEDLTSQVIQSLLMNRN